MTGLEILSVKDGAEEKKKEESVFKNFFLDLCDS